MLSNPIQILLDKLELVQRKHLKRILFLPASTANSAVHLITGTLLFQATIHQRALGFLIRILNNSDTQEYNILTRQAAIKRDKSHCWTTYIRKLLCQYDRPILYDLIDITPASSAWKLTVKRAVQYYWWTEISGDAQKRTTLNNLDLTQCHPGKLHPVWDPPLHRSAILQATTHCRMLTGTYNVQEKYNRYNSTPTPCPACKSAKETLHHLLMECPA